MSTGKTRKGKILLVKGQNPWFNDNDGTHSHSYLYFPSFKVVMQDLSRLCIAIHEWKAEYIEKLIESFMDEAAFPSSSSWFIPARWWWWLQTHVLPRWGIACKGSRARLAGVDEFEPLFCPLFAPWRLSSDADNPAPHLPIPRRPSLSKKLTLITRSRM